MTSSERVLEYLDYKGIGKREFYKATGLSNGFLDKKSNMGSDRLERISYAYPDLNLVYLITGKGEMLKTGEYLHLPRPHNNVLGDFDEAYEQLPPPLKSENPKTLAPPTAPANTDLGVKNIYLTPQIITVDNAGNDNIVYVPVRAAAGYLNGYSDPTFMEKLPSFSLPGLQNSTYRGFEVSGDSMWPTLENKEMIIGQWVEKLDYIREDRVHILVTKNDGIIVKRLLNRIEKYGYIIAKSDAVNDRNLYPNIEVHPDDILEIWYAVWHGGFNFKSPGDLWKRQNNLEADLADVLRRLKQGGL